MFEHVSIVMSPRTAQREIHTGKNTHDTCRVREEIAEALQRSHSEMVRLSDREIEAVIKGEFAALVEIEAELRNARRRHDASLEAFKNHVEAHRCL